VAGADAAENQNPTRDAKVRGASVGEVVTSQLQARVSPHSGRRSAFVAEHIA